MIRLVLLFLCVPLCACSALRSSGPGPLEDAVAAAWLEAAERALAEGRLGTAVEELAELRRVPRLDPDLRARTEARLEEAVLRRLTQLDEADAGSSKYDELFRLALPPRLRARAGLLAARELYQEGRRVSSYRKVQEVERKVPNHPDRAFAGEVLVTTGLDMVEDDGRYSLLFRYRTRGIEALEYLVLNYPLAPRCWRV